MTDTSWTEDTRATAAAACLIAILTQAVVEGRIDPTDVRSIEDLDPYIDLSNTGLMISASLGFARGELPSENDLRYAWARADAFIRQGLLQEAL